MTPDTRLLAALYGVPTKVLMQAVRRNTERFPPDFLFPLNEQDLSVLRSQIVTLETGQEADARGMHAFVRLRDLIGHNRELARRLDFLEAKYDKQFKVVFDAIRELMTPSLQAPKRRIGFQDQTRRRPRRGGRNVIFRTAGEVISALRD